MKIFSCLLFSYFADLCLASSEGGEDIFSKAFESVWADLEGYSSTGKSTTVQRGNEYRVKTRSQTRALLAASGDKSSEMASSKGGASLSKNEPQIPEPRSNPRKLISAPAPSLDERQESELFNFGSTLHKTFIPAPRYLSKPGDGRKGVNPVLIDDDSWSMRQNAFVQTSRIGAERTIFQTDFVQMASHNSILSLTDPILGPETMQIPHFLHLPPQQPSNLVRPKESQSHLDESIFADQQEPESTRLDKWLLKPAALAAKAKPKKETKIKAKPRKKTHIVDTRFKLEPLNSKGHEMIIAPLTYVEKNPLRYHSHRTNYGVEITKNSIWIATLLKGGDVKSIPPRIAENSNIEKVLNYGGSVVVFESDSIVVWTAGPYYQVLVKNADPLLKEVKPSEPFTEKDGIYTNLKPSEPFFVKEDDLVIVAPIDTPKELIENCLRSKVEADKDKELLYCILEGRRLMGKARADVIVTVIGGKIRQD